MRVVGTKVAPVPLQGQGLEPLGGVSNYFFGTDPSRWLTNVPHFARVRYGSVYEGVDLEYYGNRRRLEYDFRVGPGADPSRIALGFEGARRVRVDASGDLLVSTRGSGDVRLLKPFAYQETEGGARVEVAASYRLERGRIRFRLGAYDRTRALVIDPCVEYATFLGGASDALIAKLSADGTTLLRAAYYGGSGNANPDDNFRFAGDSYIFNLKTKGLTTGTYVLVFKAGADSSTHGVQFQVK